MKKLILLLLSALSVHAFCQQAPQLGNNWSGSNVYDYTHDPFTPNVGFTAPIGAAQIGFTFTLPVATRTAAIVTDASGMLRRTLWSNRNYPAGTEFGVIWNGLDDNGVAVPSSSGPFTITLQSNSVNFNWRGLVGFIGDPFGQNSWNSAESFPYDMVSVASKGYLAMGFDESAFQAESFPLATPTQGVKPLNTILWNGAAYEYAATDGTLLYFAARPLSGNAGVFAFDLNGYFHSFSKGTLLTGSSAPTNVTSDQTFIQTAAVQVVDEVVSTNAIITGIAVCPNSQLLATAHGLRGTVASLDEVFTWDKDTGAAGSTISVPNPHRMTCDQSGNLWIISGTGISGDILYEVPSGSTTASPSTITGLSNPVALSVSPTTGDLFVADGGSNQQVFEYNSSQVLVRTLGVAGGYGTGTTCNTVYSPMKLHLDHNGMADTLPDKFIDVDANGDLWVSDTDAGMIRHYTLTNGVWTYVNRIMFQAGNHGGGLMTNAPTRVFTGGSSISITQGSNLVEADLATNSDGTMIPIETTDPDPNLGGNGSWTITHNYIPCIETAPNWSAADGVPFLLDAWQSPTTGASMLLVGAFPTTPTFGNRIVLNSNGTITYEAKQGSVDYTSETLPDPNGNTFNSNSVELFKNSPASLDPFGLPILGTNTKQATYTAPSAALGQAQLSQLPPNGGLTANGIYPFFGNNVNTTVNAGLTAFHFGLLNVAKQAFTAQVFPQKNIGTNDFKGSFPAQNIASDAAEGAEVWDVANHTIMMYAGNGFPGSCHFFDFTDNGMLVGEFGYAFGLMSEANTGGPNGPPQFTQRHNKIPGYCVDVGSFKPVVVNSNLIRSVNGDENYLLGTQIWELQNLNSIQTFSAIGSFGSLINLH
jgi:hypothetical protein